MPTPARSSVRPARLSQVFADLMFAVVTCGAIALLLEGLADPTGGPMRIPVSRGWIAAGRLGVSVAAVGLLALVWRIWRGGEVAFWSRLRALLVSTVGGWLAYLSSDQPYHTPQVALAMGTALAGFALLCLLAVPLARVRRARAWLWLDRGATMGCMIVLGLELGLRGAAIVSNNPVLVRADAGVAELLGRFRFPAGYLRFGFPCNSHGHFDEEFTPKREGVPLMVSIGDSFAAGIVPHHYHYTTALERLLPPLRVYNLGLPTIGPAEYLHLLRTEALPLRPDLVAINLFVGNDIAQGSDPTEPWLASWFNRENVQLAAVPTRIARILRERRRLGRDDLGIVGEQGAGRAELTEVLRHFPWFLDYTRELPNHSDEEFLRIEAVRAAAVFQPAYIARYDRFFAIIDAIVAAAGSVPIVFVILPDAMQVDDELWRAVVAATPRGTLDRDQPQRMLRARFESSGYAFVDLLPDFRAVPLEPDGQRHLYQRTDTHICVRGNLRAAAALAEPVAKRLGLTRLARGAGRTVELALEPAAVAGAAGTVSIWLPGHVTVPVAVAAGETGASIVERLRGLLLAWGVPCESPDPGTVRIAGVAHHPELAGIGVEASVPGLAWSLSLSVSARAPNPAGVRFLGERVAGGVAEALDAAGAVASAHDLPTTTPPGDEAETTWTRRTGSLLTFPLPATAERLRVRGRGPATVFVDVPLAPGLPAAKRGFAPGEREPPTLDLCAAVDGHPAQLRLHCAHAGAHVMLLIGASAKYLPLDVFQPGAALALLPGETFQVVARTDDAGDFITSLPSASGPLHLQALVLPAGRGLEALEVSRHLELQPPR